MSANHGKGADRKRKKQDSGELNQLIDQETVLEKWERDPKKQYIRMIGWVKIIKEYLESRKAVGMNDPIKILTLPGRFAMDIGLFYREGIIIKTENGELNVAICDEGKGAEIANKLTKYGGVLAFSDRLLNDELREITNPIPRQFPFDVINLDLCKTLIPACQENLDSLQWIFEYQKEKGFLLLLTAREYPDPQKYLYLIEQNLESEIEFAQAYKEVFGGTQSRLCAENLTQFSQIIYPKLIGNLARSHRYKVIEHYVAHYSREATTGNTYHMTCHSFQLDPVGRNGIEKFLPRWKNLGENRIQETLGKPLIKKQIEKSNEEYSKFVPSLLISNRSENVDEILQKNSHLQQELKDQVRELIYWLNIVE